MHIIDVNNAKGNVYFCQIIFTLVNKEINLFMKLSSVALDTKVSISLFGMCIIISSFRWFI